jgi:hypothetical protein
MGEGGGAVAGAHVLRISSHRGPGEGRRERGEAVWNVRQRGAAEPRVCGPSKAPVPPPWAPREVTPAPSLI